MLASLIVGGTDSNVWERRFRAPVPFFPDWSPLAPDRAVYASNESGVWQVHAWDVSTGVRRVVSDSRVGVVDGVPTLDGEGVLWFDDETGDESGRWLWQPFHGGTTRPFLEAVPHGWSEGLAQAPGVVALGISGRDGFGIYVALDGQPAREVYRSQSSVRIGSVDESAFLRGGLSADGTLLCLEHAEHGDLVHTALRVVDPRTGKVIGEQLDGGMSLQAKCWSPITGDQRLAFVHEREGDERPGIWDLATDLEIDLEGGVSVQDWWPDGSALLLRNLFEGRNRLYRFDLATSLLTSVPSEPGYVWTARVRPNGIVWFLHEQGQRQRLALEETGVDLLPPPGGLGPAGRPYQSWHFENPHGQRVHGFFVTPDDSGGPFPVLMFVHGGPTWLDVDRWQPEVQAYADAGFVVGMVNYRGSIGYGREWRDALISHNSREGIGAGSLGFGGSPGDDAVRRDARVGDRAGGRGNGQNVEQSVGGEVAVGGGVGNG